jgi:hypothetical protein
MAFKLGKLPVDRTREYIALSDHLDRATSWPPVPATGWEYALPVSALSILGNDTVGDCVIAAMMHYAQTETANTENPLTPTTALALQTYSAITGYDPNDPSTDQGTTWAAALTYWQAKGIPLLDAKGKEVIHKIIGSAALDLNSVAQIRYACYTFGGTLMGIQCPASWEQNTANWNDPSGPVAGGHGIVRHGQGAAGWHVDSWAFIIPGTWTASQQVADEDYIVVTPLWLNTQGKSPTGLDLNGLVAAMKGLSA